MKLGDLVTKKSGSNWTGRIVGSYSTELTPVGWCVESSTEKGSVQIYPEAALELVSPTGRYVCEHDWCYDGYDSSNGRSRAHYHCSKCKMQR